MVATAVPDLSYERVLAGAGYRAIAGVDEAGRGAWAGPLVAAAVILPDLATSAAAPLLASLAEVRDSKVLTADRREAVFPTILQVARTVGIGLVPAAEIDTIGLGAANRLAWVRALAALTIAADYLLLDAFRLPAVTLPQLPLVRGDQLSLSIAAASVVAKVTRDRLLHNLDQQYPAYQFARHKGYGTAQHRAALVAAGPCAEHRLSFAPLRTLASPVTTDD